MWRTENANMPRLENRFTPSGQARTNDEIQDRNEEFTGVKNQEKKQTD